MIKVSTLLRTLQCLGLAMVLGACASGGNQSAQSQGAAPAQKPVAEKRPTTGSRLLGGVSTGNIRAIDDEDARETTRNQPPNPGRPAS